MFRIDIIGSEVYPNAELVDISDGKMKTEKNVGIILNGLLATNYNINVVDYV